MTSRKPLQAKRFRKWISAGALSEGGHSLKFLIAEDHALVRKGLVELLAEAYPRCRFVEADNVPDSIDCVLRYDLDLVVLDVSMPGGSGLDVLEAASAASPELPVLVVSTYPEDQYGPRAFRAGASGFLNKDAAPARLVEAVRAVLGGGTYFSSSVLDRVAAQAPRAPACPVAGVLDRARSPRTPHAPPAKRRGT